MFEKGTPGIPKPAELYRQWLRWNDQFLRLLNSNPRRAATVLAGAWALMPAEYSGTNGNAPSAYGEGANSCAPSPIEERIQ